MVAQNVVGRADCEAVHPGISGWRRLAVDAHVHLRGDPFAGLDAATRNFAALGREVDAGAVLLTESEGSNSFDTLRRTGSSQAIDNVGEPISLVWQGGAIPLLIVSGRQVVSAERIEVLLLGTLEAPADGMPLQQVIDGAEQQNALVILPWGVGKWIGHRGRLIHEIWERDNKVMLGDIQARASLLTASPITQARAAGRRVLSGTDALPLPHEQNRIGSFGQIVHARLDPERPGAGLIEALRSPEVRLDGYGRRQSLLELATLQWRLRRRKRGTLA